MAVTDGFFNSLNGDRRYESRAFGEVFEGIIEDGIFMNIGSRLMVTAAGGLTVNVGSGKAWYLDSWLKVDAEEPVVLDPAELILSRIDAIIMDFNNLEETRKNTIQYLKGVPSSNPEPPTLISEEFHVQKALCYVHFSQNMQEITQSEIENRVGLEDCPFITGPLETVHAAELITQWQDEWADMINIYEMNNNQIIQALEDQISRIEAGTETMLKTEYAPDATALINDNTLNISSVYSHVGSLYDVSFIMPTGGQGLPISIDGSPVSLVDLLAEETELDVADGAPIRLTRNGDLAFFKTGGASLNFRVFMGEKPASPKENDIYIPWESTFKPNVYFGPDEPTPINNLVWIPTVEAGYLTIQIVKKQEVYSAIRLPKVYDAALSKWVIPSSEIFVNEEWIPIEKILPLYTESDVHQSTTGGYIVNTQTNGSIAITTNNTLTITFTQNADANTLLRLATGKSFSVSDYNYLRFRVARTINWTWFNPTIGLAPGPTSEATKYYNIPNSSVMTDYFIDVSSLTGSYYLIIYHTAWAPGGTGRLTFEHIKLTEF